MRRLGRQGPQQRACERKKIGHHRNRQIEFLQKHLIIAAEDQQKHNPGDRIVPKIRDKCSESFLSLLRPEDDEFLELVEHNQQPSTRSPCHVLDQRTKGGFPILPRAARGQ